MANEHRLSRAGYHAVFAVAIALVGIDILLRLVMIEQRSARKWIQPQIVTETDALIGADSQYMSFGGDAPSPSTSCEDLIRNYGETVIAKSSPLPGMVRLVCSGNMLLVFAATVVNASLYASFDSVCPVVSDGLGIAADISGPSPPYHENIRLGSSRRWTLLPPSIRTIFPFSSDRRRCRPLRRAKNRRPRLPHKLSHFRPSTNHNHRQHPQQSPPIHLPLLRRSCSCPANGVSHG